MAKMMKILIAPNTMKASLDAFSFADQIEKGFKKVSSSFDILKCPVADGGDHTCEVLIKALNAEKVELQVLDPLGRQIPASYAVSGKRAIIEMADASGMKLLNAIELNPMKTSSIGTGQLIKHALNKGCDEILVAIGGSATVDGGLGLIEGLGFQIQDEQKNTIPGCGESLLSIRSVVPPSDDLSSVQIKVICDVDNPLLGERGAAAIFGPQKGASSEMVKKLETGLRKWADLLSKSSGLDLAQIEGMGAAGGVALPLVAYLGATLVPGADFILNELDFENKVKWSDLVITGEGSLDEQTLNNKAPYAVAKMAHKHNKPVIAIGGKVETEASSAFDGIFSFVNGPINLNTSMSKSAELVVEFSEQLARFIKGMN